MRVLTLAFAALATVAFAVEPTPPSPDESRVVTTLRSALAALDAGQAERAAELYRQAGEEAEGEETRFQAALGLGAALTASGREVEATAAFERAVGLRPADPVALLLLARGYAGLGRHAEAATAAAAAVRLAPDDPRAHLALGVAHYHLEQYREAVPELERAVALAPDDAGAHYALGLCRLYLDQRDLAVAEVAALNRLDPKLARDLWERIFRPR